MPSRSRSTQRDFTPREPPKESPGRATPPDVDLPLANGQVYRGPMGQVFATAIDSPTMMGDLPGQRTDAGDGPIFDASPAGRHRSSAHLRRPPRPVRRSGEAAHPGRVGTDPESPGQERRGGDLGADERADGPGRVRQVRPRRDLDHHRPRTRAGRSASFYAYAGDHYSLAQPDGRHFCVGCHPGHSGIPTSSHEHAERLR